jgi:hypothetical protein
MDTKRKFQIIVFAVATVLIIVFIVLLTTLDLPIGGTVGLIIGSILTFGITIGLWAGSERIAKKIDGRNKPSKESISSSSGRPPIQYGAVHFKAT